MADASIEQTQGPRTRFQEAQQDEYQRGYCGRKEPEPIQAEKRRPHRANDRRACPQETEQRP